MPRLTSWSVMLAEACSEAGRGAADPCHIANGFRFAAQEPDLDGLPPGNEHAIRVSSALLRSPLRYPDWVVRSNEVLPLFLAGDVPSRGEQETMLAAWHNGLGLTHLDTTCRARLLIQFRASLATAD
jgi:hypothetical protein